MKLADGYPINLPVLLETRLLIQAQSGGGKSFALRRLLEQTAPHVQQLVIDPEGEFATLREHFDYVICAPHGADAVANPQTAALLARRLLEAGVSAIIDIYDLKAHERQLFVKRFLDALITAPRDLWRPVMVVLDEAHIFAPQVGSAEACGAVIDLATRGRKRGQCLVAATQRLSKLHKDVAAELLNKLIGRASLDVDVKRAADELGVNARDAFGLLRDLKPGEFWGFGPALSHVQEKVKIGSVKTTHPKSGARLMQAPPAPSKRVLAQLSKLTDLQKEAEVEAKTIEELRALTTDLKRKLTIAERKAKEVGVVSKVVVDKLVEEAGAFPKPEAKDINEFQSCILKLSALSARLFPHETMKRLGVISTPTHVKAETMRALVSPAETEMLLKNIKQAPLNGDITTPQQKILDTLARLQRYGVEAPGKRTVAVLSGVSPNSSGYSNNLGRMRSNGLIHYPSGGTIALTDMGKSAARAPESMATLEELHAGWYSFLPTPQGRVLRELIAIYPQCILKVELARQCNVSATSSGYSNNLGRLRTLGLIEYPGAGMVQACEILFPAGLK